MFARDGLDGATTRAISREAGVNEVTLFRNFGTKEHLLEAVVGTAFAPETRERTRHPTPGGLRADLASFAEAYEALLVANLPLIRAVIGEIHRHAPCEHQALKGIFLPMREALIRRLDLACTSGEARPGTDTEIAADLFAGMVLSSVLKRSAMRRRLKYGTHAYREACVDVLVRGIA